MEPTLLEAVERVQRNYGPLYKPHDGCALFHLADMQPIAIIEDDLPITRTLFPQRLPRLQNSPRVETMTFGLQGESEPHQLSFL